MNLIKNKKGGVIFYFLAFTLLLVVGYGLYLSSIHVQGLTYPGESSQTLLSSIELSNRIAFYVDVSINQALQKAIPNMKEDSGFIIERSANYVTPFECGEAVFPLLNNEKKEVECFPDYEEKLKIEFQKEFIPKIHQFKELSLSRVVFTTNIRKNNEDILLEVYASFASYYDESIKRRMEHAMPSDRYELDPETGYMVRGGLKSFPRSNPSQHPDSIVMHYTAGHRVDDAYNTLQSTGFAYHYIIEKDGTIYNFADESRMTHHAGCQESIRRGFTCMEGYNTRSIAISFVNLGHAATRNCEIIPSFPGHDYKCWESYLEEQIESAVQLVADIVQRQAEQGRYIKINSQTILTHHEIDPIRKQDPGPLFNKAHFINRIKQELNNRGYEHET